MRKRKLFWTVNGGVPPGYDDPVVGRTGARPVVGQGKASVGQRSDPSLQCGFHLGDPGEIQTRRSYESGLGMDPKTHGGPDAVRTSSSAAARCPDSQPTGPSQR